LNPIILSYLVLEELAVLAYLGSRRSLVEIQYTRHFCQVKFKIIFPENQIFTKNLSSPIVVYSNNNCNFVGGWVGYEY